jgi:hypothetical protein
MKYKEKLSNFLNDLSSKIEFLGYHCCGTCARAKVNPNLNQSSFWILADDLDNKASEGVDLNFINLNQELISMIIEYSRKNQLSCSFSFNSKYNSLRISIYSIRGKQEYRVWEDGVLVNNI